MTTYFKDKNNKSKKKYKNLKHWLQYWNQSIPLSLLPQHRVLLFWDLQEESVR